MKFSGVCYQKWIIISVEIVLSTKPQRFHGEFYNSALFRVNIITDAVILFAAFFLVSSQYNPLRHLQ